MVIKLAQTKTFNRARYSAPDKPAARDLLKLLGKLLTAFSRRGAQDTANKIRALEELHQVLRGLRAERLSWRTAGYLKSRLAVLSEIDAHRKAADEIVEKFSAQLKAKGIPNLKLVAPYQSEVNVHNCALILAAKKFPGFTGYDGLTLDAKTYVEISRDARQIMVQIGTSKPAIHLFEITPQTEKETLKVFEHEEKIIELCAKYSKKYCRPVRR